MIDYTNEVIDTPAIGSDLNQQPVPQPSPYVGGMNPINTVNTFQQPQEFGTPDRLGMPDAQMLKLSLMSQQDPFTNALLAKHAQGVKQNNDAKILFMKANSEAKPPAEVINNAVDTYFQVNQENAMLSGAIGQINSQIKELEKTQEAARLSKTNRVQQQADTSRYYNAIDDLAKMQASAPTVPVMQTPELSQVDQALVFLAGLIGGVEQMPQAIQGAVAGATQRAQLANQMATQKFEAEQQNYGRQVQAQNTIVGKEATRLSQQEKMFADQYNRQQEEDQNTIDTAQKEITKLLGQGRTYEASIIAGLQKQYLDGKKNAIEFTTQDNVNIDTLRQAAVQAGVPPLVARGIFPYVNPGERTIKGSQIKMAEDYNNQREIASFRDFTLNQLKAIHNIANDIIDELKYVNVTDDIALAYNQRIAQIAGDSKIPRYMLPVVIAGKSGDLMKLEETERHNREIERISNWNATIAQTRLNWEKSKPKDKNEFEVWLKDKKALREKYQLDLAGYNKIINEGVGGQAVREATNEALKTQGLIDALNGVIANATAPTGAKAGTGTGAAAGQKKDKDKAKNTGTSKVGGNPKPDGNKPNPMAGDLIVTPPSPVVVPEKDGAKAGGQKPPKAKDGRIVF
jgi:hypothetical protein